MYKNLLFILLFITSFQAFALSVTMGDTTEPSVRMRLDLALDSFASLIVEGGAGTTIDNAYEVYMPIRSGASGTDTQNVYQYEGKTAIPGVTSTLGGMVFDLEYDNGGTSSHDLYIAVRNDADDDFRIIKKLGDTDATFTALMSLSELCHSDIISTDLDRCTKLILSSEDQIIEVMFYVFMAAAGHARNFEIDPSDSDVGGVDISHGLFIKTFFSTHIKKYTAPAEIILNSISIDRGDGSAYLSYNGDNGESSYITRLALYEGTTASKHFNIYDIGAKSDGDIFISGLTNGTTYTFTAAYVDKFGFVADDGGFPLIGTAQASVTPEEIEALLKEKSCYLVTAGFQRDHYVLDYFRYIRDQYITKSFIGSKFVAFYYATAPKYAKAIYQSEFLSGSIRMISYVIYGCIKFAYISLPIFLLLLMLIRSKGKWLRKYSL